MSFILTGEFWLCSLHDVLKNSLRRLKTSARNLGRELLSETMVPKGKCIWSCICVYSYFEKGRRKNVHATIPKDNMGYDQYTVSDDDCSCRTYFCCFPLTLANTFPWPSVPIVSNLFEKQRTQNHPQCLSGLSRALFPTTFLEIAVCSFVYWDIRPM